MKQYTFKDGTKVIASSVEEAKSKHKVVSYIHHGMPKEIRQKLQKQSERDTPIISKKAKELYNNLKQKSGDNFKVHLDSGWIVNDEMRIDTSKSYRDFELKLSLYVGKNKVRVECYDLPFGISDKKFSIKTEKAINYVVNVFNAFNKVKEDIFKLSMAIRNK